MLASQAQSKNPFNLSEFWIFDFVWVKSVNYENFLNKKKKKEI